MKTRIQSLSYLATLAVILGMVSWGSALNAQSTGSTPSSQQPPQAQQPSPDPAATPQQPQTPAPTPDNTPSTQQPSSPQVPPDQAQAPSSKETAAGTPAAGDSREFMGTVVKQGDKYVLQDDSGHTYDIDHQDEVKKFEGKRVRVQGKLDDSQKKILVK